MDISWITDRIAVGGAIWTSENMTKVAGLGVTHIIDMQAEFDDTPLAKPFGIEVCWNPIADDFQPKGPEVLQKGVDFAMRALSRSGAKLFIHCAAGIHRGPMMALAVLRVFGFGLEDSLRMIESKRYVVDFAKVYVDSVERFVSASAGASSGRR